MGRLAITDLGGSINEGRPASELAPNEFTGLTNFYQFGGRLRRRGGIRRLTTSAFAGGRVTGLFSYRPETLPPGGVDMIVGSLSELGILVGSSIAAIPPQAGFSFLPSTRPWTGFQYKNIFYGIREHASIIRSDGTYFGPAGVAAPLTAPTLADGGAGSIPAANFKGVYTFYNPTTNLESNPSPVSNTLALGANRQINWSGIGVSSNVQVTARRLYRSLPDQSGEYFRVATINNNVDTTYTGDNTLAQDLGDAVSFNNGEPFPNQLFGAVWKERLFCSDGVDLFHSELGLIEAFDPDSVIPVFPDDGHSIRAIHAYGDRLVVGKTNKIHYLVGSDPSSFALLTLSDRHGCIAHHSMQSAEGYLFWLGPDNIYRSDGTNVTGIASVKLRNILAAMDVDAAHDAVATVYPSLGWYKLVIPDTAVLIYNYRTDVWARVIPATDIVAVGDFFDGDLQRIYVSDAHGHVYHFNDITYGFDDDESVLGNAISANFGGRGFIAEAGTKHIIERVGLFTKEQYAEDVEISLLCDGVIKARTVSLDYTPGWQIYSLSTRHRPAVQSQFGVAYSGETAIEIDGYALDIYPIRRDSMRAR